MEGQKIIQKARQRNILDTWYVFEGNKKRYSLNDPSPMIVLVPEGLVEYVDSRFPITVIEFSEIKELYLRIVTKKYDENSNEKLIDFVLIHLDGTYNYWGPQSDFDEDEELILQRLIELHALYRFLHRTA